MTDASLPMARPSLYHTQTKECADPSARLRTSSGLALLVSGQFLHARHALPVVACHAIAAPLTMFAYVRFLSRRTGPSRSKAATRSSGARSRVSRPGHTAPVRGHRRARDRAQRLMSPQAISPRGERIHLCQAREAG